MNIIIDTSLKGGYIFDVVSIVLELGKKNQWFYNCILFVRNIIEYIKDKTDDYKKQKAMLDIKENTRQIKICDIISIFKKHIKQDNFPKLDTNKYDLTFLLKEANFINKKIEKLTYIEDKTLLSIAIRQITEIILINSLQITEFTKKNQTAELVNKFKTTFANTNKKIQLFNLGILPTSDNIHINSFMFEPILDIYIYELQDLYEDIITLYGKEKLFDDFDL